MAVRLTRKQMSEKYPNQWIGISNVKYKNVQHKEIESADVVYTDKTASELGMMSLRGEGVQPLFTTPDNVFQLGMIGGVR